MRKTIVLVFLTTLAFGQSSDEMVIRILQDKRESGTTELLNYLRSPNPKYRELALLALGNIQDTASGKNIVPLLNDQEPAVRSMAAFALGMIGNREATVQLFHRLPVEKDEKTNEAIFNAIGLCGGTEDLAELIRRAEDHPADRKSSIVRSITRFANRKIVNTDATRFIVSLLDDSANISEAIYALMRINDATVIHENRRRLAGHLDNPSPVIRMWSALALRGVNDGALMDRLLVCAEEDPDWRVRVNAITALRANRVAKDRILKLAIDSNGHVSLAAITAYDALTRNEPQFSDSTFLFSLLSTPQISPPVREEARRIIAKKLENRAFPYIGEWRSDQPYISALRVKAYGAIHTKESVNVLRNVLAQSQQSIVTIAAIESYQSIVRGWPADEQELFLSEIVPLLNNRDAGISYAVALVFQDTIFSRSLRQKFLPPLLRAYNTMDASLDLEPMIEFLKIFGDTADSTSLAAIQKGLGEKDETIKTAARQAFVAITGKEFALTTNGAGHEYTPFYRESDLALLVQYSGARIRTSRGLFTIRFEKAAAPLTVLNFMKLAQKGFYNGLYFHRVVGNFVIQGGDPLGNGSGGPHYSIRTEVHPHVRYTAGAVGMASAGKDTEGSQWFVTHCPTPHLDYRYSIFGYVDDRTVVDRIMIGDRIDSIELF
jgi:cyclophilin family peptidyl-prolyl cis-trans isomerase/HEAT repeat protein